MSQDCVWYTGRQFLCYRYPYGGLPNWKNTYRKRQNNVTQAKGLKLRHYDDNVCNKIKMGNLNLHVRNTKHFYPWPCIYASISFSSEFEGYNYLHC